MNRTGNQCKCYFNHLVFAVQFDFYTVYQAMSLAFLMFGVSMLISIMIIVNHPVSADHTFWKNIWKSAAVVCTLMQLTEIALHVNHGSLYVVVAITVLVLASLVTFSNRIVLGASSLTVVVINYTIYTYKVWNTTGGDWLPVLHGFLRQFSLVGLLLYVIAHEL